MAIASHRGMGDLIICNAIFRYFGERHSVVIVPVKYGYFDSATYMLRDAPSILVVPARSNKEASHLVNTFRASGPVLFIGNQGVNYRREDFDRSFYEQVGLPFETRWSGFKLVRDASVELEAPEQPYAFLHDDPSRGLTIDRSKPCFSGLPERVPTVGVTQNIFAWLPTILAAAEIHCIDSSCALLVDSLQIDRSVRLYLHRYARLAITIPTYRLHWQYLT